MRRGPLTSLLILLLTMALVIPEASAYRPERRVAKSDPADLGSEARDIGASALVKDVEIELSLEPQGDRGLPRVFTLDDCIRLSLSNSRRLKGTDEAIEAAKGQLDEAKALFWPVIEYNWRIAPVPTDVNNAFDKFFDWQITLFNSLHFGLGIPLTAFGKLQTARHMAEGGVDAARIDQEKLRENTIFQVKQLYYGILLAKETVKLLDDAVQRINDKLAEEEAKEDKELDPYDMLQMKLTKVDLERRVDEARANLEVAYEGMRLQMDLEPGADIKFDTDSLMPIPVDLGKMEDYADAGVMSQPDAKLLEIGVQTKKLQYRLEKLKLAPEAGFGFFVELGRTTGFVAGITATGDYNNPFNYTRAGIGIQFKGTLDIHGAYGRIKKARAEYYKASFDRLFARRAISLDIKRAYLNAKRAQEDVRRAKRAQSLTQQMTFVTKINIDTGIGDTQKYGDALKLYLITHGLYYKAVFDYNVSLADLQQKVGLAKYDELTPSHKGGDFDLFEPEDEGFETYEGKDTSASADAERTKGADDADKL